MAELDEDIKSESCGICRDILTKCKELGDKKFCKIELDKVKSGKVSTEQFAENLKTHFNRDIFKEATE